MKALIYLSVILFFMITSCKKPGDSSSKIPAYQPVYFEIVDQDGRSAISNQDVVSISYQRSGITNTFKATLRKLYKTLGDTTVSSKYKGLYLDDGQCMTNAQVGAEAPIHNFTLYLNGVSMDNIYFDYYPFIERYPAATTTALTFNGVPALFDNDAGWTYVALFRVNVPQLSGK